MDIASRLKRFLEANKITNSQFADTCEIPRPTVTQLLNGRNKKVSDEVIRKIHAAYPALSVMWLMFGEEPMLIGVASVESSDGTHGRNTAQVTDSKPRENSLFGNDLDSFRENENLTESVQEKKIVFSGEEFVSARKNEGFSTQEQTSQRIAGAPTSDGYGRRISNQRVVSVDADSSVNAISQALERIAMSAGQRKAAGPGQPSVQGQKRIVNVMVFYSDNSFESFSPEK